MQTCAVATTSREQPATEKEAGATVVDNVVQVQPDELTPETGMRPEGKLSVKLKPIGPVPLVGPDTLIRIVVVSPTATTDAAKDFVTMGKGNASTVICVAATEVVSVPPLPTVVTMNDGLLVKPAVVPDTLITNVHFPPGGRTMAPELYEKDVYVGEDPTIVKAVLGHPDTEVKTFSGNRMPVPTTLSINETEVIVSARVFSTVIVANVKPVNRTEGAEKVLATVGGLTTVTDAAVTSSVPGVVPPTVTVKAGFVWIPIAIAITVNCQVHPPLFAKLKVRSTLLHCDETVLVQHGTGPRVGSVPEGEQEVPEVVENVPTPQTSGLFSEVMTGAVPVNRRPAGSRSVKKPSSKFLPLVVSSRNIVMTVV